VYRLLRRAAERAPLALILEDLHWGDEPSLRLLGFLAARFPADPVMLVTTAREEELPGVPLLRQLLQEVPSRQVPVTISLAPLSEPDTLALARTLAPVGRDGLPPELATRVWTFSRGNPFMVVEVVRALRDTPLVVATGAVPLPERVRELIAARLGRLSDRGRHLLALAAVIGHAIPFPLLRLAAGLGEDDVAAGVEELVRRRVLAAVGDRFEFAHDRLQEVAYGSLLPPVRQALHTAVGQTLESLHGNELDAITDRLAYHYAQAANPVKAVQYLQTFAEQAALRYAHEEAVAALKEALGHVERLPAPDRDRRLIDLLIALASSLFVLERHHEIVDCLLPFRDRVEKLTDLRSKAAYDLWLGHAYASLSDQAKARVVVERALEAARLSDDTVFAGHAHVLLAWIAWSAGHPTTGIRLATDAIAFLERPADERLADQRYWLGTPYGLTVAYWVLAANQSLRGEFGPALDALARSDAMARAIGHRLLQAVDRWFRVEIHARRGDWERAVSEGVVALEELPNPFEAPFFVTPVLGWALCAQGRVDEGIAVLERNVEHLRTMREKPMLAKTLVSLGAAYLWDDRPDDARRAAAEGLEMASSVNFRSVVGSGEHTLGQLALAMGELDASDRFLTQAFDTFTAMRAPLELALTRLDLAELAAVRGDRAMAASQLRAAHDALRALDVPCRVEQAERLALCLGVRLEVP
jgi:tetratricopeptide (TPR) repeat protein